jgi:hypothetical protein
MKSYIPHRILVINRAAIEHKDEETLSRCYQLAFDWANRMGQEGKKVFDLFLEKPDYGKDPLNIGRYYLWCKMECTIEEREKWDVIQKLNIQHAVFTALKDDDETN